MSNPTSAVPITSLLSVLEETNDPAIAYFSFTADDKGEYGVINANKEGLRLYAMDLLRKSVEMENRQDGNKLTFKPQEWLISDAGYDLIRAVQPEYKTRHAILADRKWYSETDPVAKQAPSYRHKNHIGKWLFVILSLASVAALIKWIR
jgi:hypothetical protein